MKCDDCKNMIVVTPNFDEPHGSIYCQCMHWEGLGFAWGESGPDVDMWADCKDFEEVQPS